MGCVSSAYLQEEEGRGGTIIGHHIVSLTSTTYGHLTTLDQPTTTPSPSPSPSPPIITSYNSPPSSPEVINSWELMAGLDPITPPVKPKIKSAPETQTYTLSMFEKRCPPGGGEAAILYTTTLRGIRKTFEDCNAVRSAIEGIGVAVRERDVSMDLGFREELRDLMKGKGKGEGPTVPRLFVKGRYVGGAEQVLRIHEEGALVKLLEGMPRRRRDGAAGVCDGCGGIRFLPCFRCNGSRKVVVGEWKRKGGGGGGDGGKEKGKVVRCGECNENGLVLCPICC